MSVSVRKPSLVKLEPVKFCCVWSRYHPRWRREKHLQRKHYANAPAIKRYSYSRRMINWIALPDYRICSFDSSIR